MPSALYQPMLSPLSANSNGKVLSNGNGNGNGNVRRQRGPSSMAHNWRHYLSRNASGATPTGGARKFIVCAVLIFLVIVYLVWYSRAELEASGSYPGKSTNSYAASAYAEGVDMSPPHSPPPLARVTNQEGSKTKRIQKGRVREKNEIMQRLQNNSMTKTSDETSTVCSEYFVDKRAYIQHKPRQEYAKLPIIYFVTPTYPRREQFAELTRLAHTLLHVPRLHWILADDHPTCSPFLSSFCQNLGIPYTHISSPMPDKFRTKKPMPRGVANRRAAISWLQQRNITNGVLYFGDDDNTYDLKLFSEIRTTQRVSMLPVGLIAAYSVSGPLVRKSKVVGFLDSWVADRHWPVDMAGFAVNLAYMAEHPNANMPFKAGYEEDFFLRSIGLRLDYIEPKGKNCTEILVWHTQTKSEARSVVQIKRDYLDGRSNLGALFKNLEIMGVAVASDTEGKKAVVSKNGKAKDMGYFFS